ncbi:S1/P1 nuclease [Podospora appendiculata]|uniref:S1/P1 nuclease n=1 Tax=Podospora appendiculata TaxID=314037 RepID=A0AAE0XLU1_9PEZI|nr:S1/P1 nuclease [Podospora appendiculata]
MVKLLSVAVLAASSLPQALAWGAMGHYTVAYVASNFVSSKTKTYMQSLLADTSANYLASVANWADSYRSTTAGAFSAPFHYIDAEDSPPSSCGVSFSRDCGSGGCVVSAISNYTTRLLNTGLTTAQRQDAAKFLVHFLGDIGQPLHCENLDVGGNTIDVTYGSSSTNLHAVWDTKIPEKISGGSTMAIAKTWAANLTAEINSGTFASQAAGWVSGLSITASQSSALTWATESNSKVCSVVIPNGVSAVESVDLSGAYTTSATPTVRLQIAKQGYRLAKWLDAIVAAV